MLDIAEDIIFKPDKSQRIILTIFLPLVNKRQSHWKNVGSDFTLQLQAYAGYRFTKLFQLTGGYRILSTDYTKGSGVKQFILNVNDNPVWI